MEPKRIETQTTEQGCNVRHITHEDGSVEVTLDTGRHPVLRVVGSVYDHAAEYARASGESRGRVWP